MTGKAPQKVEVYVKPPSRKKPKTKYSKIKRILDDVEYGSDYIIGSVEKKDKAGKHVTVKFSLLMQISSMQKYTQFVRVLALLDEGDDVIITINNYGGYVATGTYLINHMELCKAKIKGIASGMCASMAPLIWLSCDEIEILPHTMVMFHPVQSMDYGAISNIRASADATLRQMEALFTSVACPFITAEEIAEMSKSDREFWITYEESLARLERFKKERRGNHV